MTDQPRSTALTSSEEPSPRVRISGPAAFVGTVPALLGFHPTESLVVVFIDSQRLVQCTMRVDLTEGVLSEVDRVSEVCERANASTVMLVIYSAKTGDSLPWADEVSATITELTRMGIEVRDALRVDQGRFRSYVCDDRSCCPPEGVAVPAAISELEAHRVLRGSLTVADSRDELRDTYRLRPELAPDTRAYAKQADQLTLPLRERCAQAISDLGELMGATKSDDVRVRLALLLGDVIVRDYLLAVLVRDHDDLIPAAEALTSLSLGTVEEHRPAVAVTAACLHMATGDNPVAVWTLLDLAEGLPLAALLRTGMEHAIHPDQVRSLLTEAFPVIDGQVAHAT